MKTMKAITATNTTIDLLRTVRGLHGLSDRDLSRLSQRVTHCSIREGEVLAHEGAHGRQAFIVVKGSGTVTVNGEVIATIGPGDFVGEMSMLDQKPRCATARADTPMEVLVIGPNDFSSFIDDARVARAIALQLSQRLRRVEVPSAGAGV